MGIDESGTNEYLSKILNVKELIEYIIFSIYSRMPKKCRDCREWYRIEMGKKPEIKCNLCETGMHGCRKKDYDIPVMTGICNECWDILDKPEVRLEIKTELIIAETIKHDQSIDQSMNEDRNDQSLNEDRNMETNQSIDQSMKEDRNMETNQGIDQSMKEDRNMEKNNRKEEKMKENNSRRREQREQEMREMNTINEVEVEVMIHPEPTRREPQAMIHPEPTRREPQDEIIIEEEQTESKEKEKEKNKEQEKKRES